MSQFRFTLLSDGSSDQVLSPVLVWLLRRQKMARAIQPTWADLRWLRRPPADLAGRIALTLELGRRRRRFSVQTGARRVVEFIEDFSPLLELSAFRALDDDLREIVQDRGWTQES